MYTPPPGVRNAKLTPSIMQDLLVNRPAPGIQRRIFIATDTPWGIFADTGVSWQAIGPGAGAAVNFANTNLTADADRIHDWAGHNYTQQNIVHYLIEANNTGGDFTVNTKHLQLNNTVNVDHNIILNADASTEVNTPGHIQMTGDDITIVTTGSTTGKQLFLASGYDILIESNHDTVIGSSNEILLQSHGKTSITTVDQANHLILNVDGSIDLDSDNLKDLRLSSDKDLLMSAAADVSINSLPNDNHLLLSADGSTELTSENAKDLSLIADNILSLTVPVDKFIDCNGVVRVETLTALQLVVTNAAKELASLANLPVNFLNSGTGASSGTFWRGDGTWAAPSGGGTTTNALSIAAELIAGGATTFNGSVARSIAIQPGSVINAMLANSTISGVALGAALAALTATDTTLTFSGSYTGATARTVGLNLSNVNTWLANVIFQLTVTTGTGATAGMQLQANSLTTGNALDASSSSLTTGNIVKIASTSTTVNGGSGLKIDMSGANSTASKTTTGLSVSVANTGTTPVNIGIDSLTTSGGVAAKFRTASSGVTFQELVGTPSYYAMYLTGVTPSSTNYSAAFSVGQTVIGNGATSGSVDINLSGGTAGIRVTPTNVGIGNISPAASAKVDIGGTTQGVLLPRGTTTQKNAIASPAEGLLFYDTTLHKLCVFTTAWETITSI